MIEPARHVPLRPIRWSESDAAAAIEDIVADGLEHFDAERFWPAHPLDEGIRDGHTSFYFGATGMVWGIDYLGRVGATKARFDFRPFLPRLLEASQAEFAKWKYAAHGSLLLGDIGAALVVMRLDSDSAIADLVYARADANTTLPVRELMWGIPGSMIACCHMEAMTRNRVGERCSRFRPRVCSAIWKRRTMVRCGRKTCMAASCATSDRCMVMPAT